MLITIGNLPYNVRYGDIKDLLRNKCGFTELILDNLTGDGKGKRVTVGLADESDANVLKSKLNGFILNGSQLYVEDVRRKKKPQQSTQPALENWSKPSVQPTLNFEVQRNIPQIPKPLLSMNPTMQSMNPTMQPMNPTMQSMNPTMQSMNPSMQPIIPTIQPMNPTMQTQPTYNLPFYMAATQSSQISYAKLTPPASNTPQQLPYYKQNVENFMYPSSNTQNQWNNKQLSTSYPDKSVLPNVSKNSYDHLSQNDMGNNSCGFNDNFRSQENNWNNKSEFESHGSNKDFRNYEDERYEQEGRYKKQKRSRVRYENRPINEGRSNNSSRFDRSPPRGRPSERDRQSDRDRQSERDRIFQRNRPSERDRQSERGRPSEHARPSQRDGPSQFGGPSQRDGRSQRGGQSYRQAERGRQNQRDPSPQYNRQTQHDQPNHRERSPMRSRPSYRDRSPLHDRSPPRDRFRNQGNRERPSKRAFEDRKLPKNSDRPDSPFDVDNYDQCQDFNNFERNDRQGGFVVERTYPNVPEKSSREYGNDPNNSTFITSNENIFHQAGTVQIFDMQNRKHDVNTSGPPTKIAKLSKEGIQPGNNLSNPATIVPKNAEYKQQLIKHNYFREKSAVLLATKIIANGKIGKINNYKQLIQHLKKCIMSRIDVILGDRIVNSLDEMINSYRQKFGVSDDANFLTAVLEKLARDKAESARNVPDNMAQDVKNKPPQFNDQNIITKYKLIRNVPKINQNQNQNAAVNKPIQKTNPNNPAVNKQIKPPNIPKNVPQNVPQQPARLPKYPEGNKQLYKDQKKILNLEMNSDLYTLEPILEKAVDREMGALNKAFLAGCIESSYEGQDLVNQRIIKHTVRYFNQVVKLQIRKRLLDKKDGLIVRIFTNPKNPNRDKLDAFLRSVGVVNLKKSDKTKMFVANCDSYESYDKLVAMKTAKIGDTEITFKPLHLIGPPEKKGKGKKAKSIKKKYESMAPSDEDIDAAEFEDFTSDDIFNDNQSKPKEDLNASLDVVLIEKNNEIVVIDDDHKDEKVENNEEISEITADNTNKIKDTDIEIKNKGNVPQILEVQQDKIEYETIISEVKQYIENIENNVEENDLKVGDKKEGDKNREGDANEEADTNQEGDANQEGNGVNDEKNKAEIEATVVNDIDDSILDSVDAIAEDDLEDF